MGTPLRCPHFAAALPLLAVRTGAGPASIDLDYGVNCTGSQVRTKGPKSAVTFTVNLLPRYCSGTRHEYEQVNPHPYRKLPLATSCPEASLMANLGSGGR